jgi:hypothetical protein
MNPGQQISIVVINNGVIVQHPPQISLVDADGSPQGQTQNLAFHKASYEELFDYLKKLELFQDQA